MYIYKSDSKTVANSSLVNYLLFHLKNLYGLAIWYKILPISIHLSLWIAYKLFLFYFNVIRGGIPGGLFWIFTGFSTFIEPLIFYAYYFYLIPKLLEKKKVLQFMLISLSIILFVPFLAIYYVQYLKNTIPFLPEVLNREINYISHHLSISFNLFIFIGLASGARFAVDWFKNQRLKIQLEKQNMLSEAALLRSQVNPHFLFNTLNNIYSLSYKNDKNAPEAILKLSGLMRYMLYEAGEEKVALEKEVAYINNYIDLQKLRLQNPLQVNFEIQGNYMGKTITPMLLIPFVENAFKHGVALHKPEEIYFGLKIWDNLLTFKTVNSIVKPQRVGNDTFEKGIGFKNVRRRLELLYPEKHDISIEKTKDKFIVHLTIKLV